jgi:hypothetical protein
MPTPNGVTAPIPVTTTRRIIWPCQCSAAGVGERLYEGEQALSCREAAELDEMPGKSDADAVHVQFLASPHIRDPFWVGVNRVYELKLTPQHYSYPSTPLPSFAS